MSVTHHGREHNSHCGLAMKTYVRNPSCQIKNFNESEGNQTERSANRERCDYLDGLCGQSGLQPSTWRTANEFPKKMPHERPSHQRTHEIAKI